MSPRRATSAPPRRRARAASFRPSAARSPLADAVHRAAGRLPRVVRRARTEAPLVLHHSRVSPNLLRALRVAEEHGVVGLLPDEDEVDGGHELGDEVAAGRGTRKRVGRDAVPAAVVVAVAGPELDFLAGPFQLDELDAPGFHAATVPPENLEIPGQAVGISVGAAPGGRAALGGV